jgi:hypothetical protein
MAAVRAIAMPGDALLAAYTDRGFTDAYAADVDPMVDLGQFIRVFYDSPAFRLERWLLAAAGMRSTPADLEALADGRGSRFAAWTVEARATGQILLAASRTRSWLAVQQTASGTTLRFGSAVVARADGRMGVGFSALLGFHRAYSRILLGAAARRLARGV